MTQEALTNKVYHLTPQESEQSAPLSPTAQEYPIALFTNMRDKHPSQQRWSWESMKRNFSYSLPLPKKDGRCFSPALYMPGTTRGKENIEHISMLVADMDSGAPYATIQEIVAPYTHIYYTTYSHTEEHQKYRIILPLTRPIPAVQWPEYWERSNLLFNGLMDIATKDASRIYFMPSYPVGKPKGIVRIHEAAILDPETLPAAPPPVKLHQTATSLATSKPLVGEVLPSALGTMAQYRAMEDRCAFVRMVTDPQNQMDVPEPQWMAFLSNACRFDAAEAAHEGSMHHPEYDPEDVDKRLERYREAPGPVTCERIQEYGFTGCPQGGCVTPTGRVTKSPAGLGSWAASAMTGSRDGKITPYELATTFLHARFRGLLTYLNSRFYYYDQGYYHAITDLNIMKQEIMNFLRRQGEKISISMIEEIYKLLTIQQAGEHPEPGPLVCLQNGTLNPRTGELLAHSPDHRLFYKLPIVWDPAATAPRWLAFLEEIFRDDADKPEKILLFQEFMGYLLIPETPYHKFLWLIGTGANGKSVLISIMEALVGRENVSHAQIQRLDKAYVRAELEGKLLNVSSEMSPEATLPESYLKQIVGGDFIEAERKYERPFSFRPFCKLVGATNELPRLLDTTHGFSRRAIMIKFNRRFEAQEQNSQLTQELLEELPGILSWAVEGLHRLHEQSGFTVVTSSTEMVAEYQTDSDPVRLFMDHWNYEDDPEGRGVQASILYDQFKAWALENGFQGMNSATFGKKLASIGIGRMKRHDGRYYQVKRKGGPLVGIETLPTWRGDVTQETAEYVI